MSLALLHTATIDPRQARLQAVRALGGRMGDGRDWCEAEAAFQLCLAHSMGGVANYRIWAPWRLEYVKDASKDFDEGCIFCTAAEEHDDRDNLIVHRGESCYVILNKFPYTNGHLMVAPYAHLATLPNLDAETVAEMMALAQKAITVLDEVYGPQGYNAGLNQGRIAGAGYADHIHLHVVPRWAGDTNYMPVLADTRVMPQSLEDSYDSLVGKF